MKNNDKTIVMLMLAIFSSIVILTTQNIDIALKEQRLVKETGIAANAIVSENTIHKFVANAQIINSSTVIIANATITEEDIEEAKKRKEEQQAAQAVAQSGVATAGWAWPTDGGWFITSNYGWRTDPWSGYGSFHQALDISGFGYGANIYAANNGTIHERGWNRSYGNYIIINHGQGNYTLYAHMNGFANVWPNTKVAKGQVIGYIGSTGASTGPHLHFELWNGVPWNGGQHISPWSVY